MQILARKMVATFKLCSEQLSSQDHYDYGMRAVKSTITACGNLKGGYPDDPEDALVLRGLRDINVPKFLAPDLPLFHGIISDLFPGVPPPDVDYSALKGALADACAAAAPVLQPVPPFIDKAIQLYETTLVRHGLMLVGGPMAGKSCAYRALAAAMTALSAQEVPGASFPPVRITALNPKAVTMGQLYGEFDPNTHEWTDGVLACHMRTAAEDTSNAVKWLMFDGCDPATSHPSQLCDGVDLLARVPWCPALLSMSVNPLRCTSVQIQANLLCYNCAACVRLA